MTKYSFFMGFISFPRELYENWQLWYRFFISYSHLYNIFLSPQQQSNVKKWLRSTNTPTWALRTLKEPRSRTGTTWTWGIVWFRENVKSLRPMRHKNYWMSVKIREIYSLGTNSILYWRGSWLLTMLKVIMQSKVIKMLFCSVWKLRIW